jgi:phosphate starvation-inducible protein PhoH and related proteins
MGEVKVGDAVTGRDGLATTVTGVYPQGSKTIVRIDFSDGVSVECCDEHLWTVSTDHAKSWITMSTSRILDSFSPCAAPDSLLEIPLVSPVEFTPQPPPLVDPYLFGLVIGALSAHWNATDFPASEMLPLPLQKWSDFEFYQSTLPKGTLLPPTSLALSNFTHQLCAGFRWSDLKTILSLASCSSLSNKTTSREISIPPAFLRSSIPSRLALLRGLCDSSARCNDSDGFHKLHLWSSSQSFSEGIVELVQSLGGTVSRIIATTAMKTETSELLDLRLAVNPFSLPRKVNWFAKLSSELRPQRFIISVTRLREDQCVCISVSAKDRLYVTDHFVVTHNTIQAIAATSMYQPEWPVLVFTPSSARYHWKVTLLPPPPLL